MAEFAREAAVDRVEALLDTVLGETMPVPVREVWVYGDVALGLDPVERLDVYLTKDLLLEEDHDAAERFAAEHGVEGVGRTIRAEWAEANPELLRANDHGHVAPERCLGAHLVEPGEPIHLEVCNASFEDNVTQRLEGARARENYEQLLDPRGVCLWVDDGSEGGPDEPPGQRSDEALAKLRSGELVFPTLAEALEMLGMESAEAERAADELAAYRERQEGRSVRGDVV